MDVDLFFFKYGAIHYHMHAQVFSDLRRPTRCWLSGSVVREVGTSNKTDVKCPVAPVYIRPPLTPYGHVTGFFMRIYGVLEKSRQFPEKIP